MTKEKCSRCGGPMKTRTVTDTAGASDTLQVFFIDFCPACEERQEREAGQDSDKKKGGEK